MNRRSLLSSFVASLASLIGLRAAEPKIRHSELGNIRLYKAVLSDDKLDIGSDGLRQHVYERVLWRELKGGERVIAMAVTNDRITSLESWTVGPKGYVGKTQFGIPGCEVLPETVVDMLEPLRKTERENRAKEGKAQREKGA